MKDLGGQLQRWCKQHGMEFSKKESMEKEKKLEGKFSRNDIIELMGTNRRVYRRGKGGALKQ
ncbi:hypothetical protein BKP37_12790 [Anaerobacillus alkalilacustris]|uniref:Uncharacterized protein n=1 Tax=Anaerobacillus alkalilacustris TaxID=393763 RepID=A0A1S2LKT3_9BACI|nr:hypothetical protein [Anaerobacillus alkalilacustris]OIJ12673.1 hypothetical protein BKP37_12790 [Anaerobacillus alkalilacustris]